MSKARAQTPGCAKVLHFNSAGAALMPQVVVDSVVAHLRRESDIGGYEAAEAAKGQRKAVKTSIAKLLNGHPDEVALVENATRGWDMAFYGLRFKSGDRILTCEAEYGSNVIAYLQVAKRTGAQVVCVPGDGQGQISLEALRQELKKGAALVGLTHVPTNGGLVNPAEEVGKLTKEFGVPYLLDACQSVGQRQMDVAKLGCDMLSATGRKFLRGPRGTGFLWVRKDFIPRIEPPLLDLHAATWSAADRYDISPTAQRFENWESYVAGHLALGAAVDLALAWGIPTIQARIEALASRLREQLAALPGVTVRDLGQEKCGIVTFDVKGVPSADVRAALARKRINVTTTGPGGTRYDFERRQIPVLVRASVHIYNTEQEIAQLVAEVKGLAAGYPH